MTVSEQPMKRYPKIFSGENSSDLWDTIKRVRKPRVHDALYDLGCHCQQLEETVRRLEQRIAQLEDR